MQRKKIGGGQLPNPDSADVQPPKNKQLGFIMGQHLQASYTQPKASCNEVMI